jgi:predicted acylesterase/phospholipase RssA
MKSKGRILSPLEAVNKIRNNNNGQVVLVLQGGGALGAYQGGVYEALHETGVEPDWIIGTSIGAINAALITGNKPEDRLPRLKEFWKRVERATFWGAFPAWAGAADARASWLTLTSGISGLAAYTRVPWFSSASWRRPRRLLLDRAVAQDA